jgi:hypothetical protein
MESPNGRKRAGVKRLLRLWLRGAAEFPLFAPAWLVPAVYGIRTPEGQLLWLLHLPLMTLLGAALAHPVRRTWLRWAAAASVGAAELPLLSSTWWQGALLATAGGAAVLRGMAAASAASRAADAQRCGAGVVACALGALICSRLPEWSVYMPWLTAAGVVSLALAMFTWNRRLLQYETRSAEEKAVPASAQGHNRLMVAALFALAVGVTAFLSGAFGRLLRSLLRAALGMLATAPSEPPAAQPPPMLPPRPQLPPSGEAGWFAKALDVLLAAIGTAVIAAAVVLLVRGLYRRRHEITRRVARLLARLEALLGRTSRPADDAGYVDEEIGLWSRELVERAVKRGWLRRFAKGAGQAEERWNGLRDNRERVRFLYRQWLRRLRDTGYAAPRHLTPDEIRRDAAAWTSSASVTRRRRSHGGGEDDAALVELYYKARYGEADIADGELERLRRRQR